KLKKIFRTSLYNLMLNTGSVWYDDVNTEEKETVKDILTESFKITVDSLKTNHSTDTGNWAWGRHHQLSIQHPIGKKVDALNKMFGLNTLAVPASGSYHTVAPFSYSQFEPSKIQHGVSHRHIYSVANWDSSYTVIPAGNSGQPASEFYTNQFDDFINGRYHHDWFSKQAVVENAIYEQNYVPE
ncbi:MAG: penicillin acylase family protein, partial [Bacteroidales bacterium]|nr:penicillin acylase family protein [Bacteroidales bacterium]